MKQFCMMALAGLLVVGCQEVPKGYVINGEVENMPDGKIYLKSFRNKMFFDVAKKLGKTALFYIFFN